MQKGPTLLPAKLNWTVIQRWEPTKVAVCDKTTHPTKQHIAIYVIWSGERQCLLGFEICQVSCLGCEVCTRTTWH